MAGYFLDTSALVKRYAAENGTAWVRHLTDRQQWNAIYISDAAGPELIAALVRKAKGNAVSLPDLQQAMTAFRHHWRTEYRRIRIHDPIIEQAMLLAEKHALRGYDAVHLATALELADVCRQLGIAPPILVSADVEQIGAAVAEGLAVENPNLKGELPEM